MPSRNEGDEGRRAALGRISGTIAALTLNPLGACRREEPPARPVPSASISGISGQTSEEYCGYHRTSCHT